jgi:hypothetical protein
VTATQTQICPADDNPLRRGIHRTFAKLSSGLPQSSLMQLSVPTRLVFLMLLSQADWNGYVYGDDESLARIFNVPIDDFIRAIDELSRPDPCSTNRRLDGRRVVRMQGNRFLVVSKPYFGLQQPITSQHSSSKKNTIDIEVDRGTDTNRGTVPPHPGTNTPSLTEQEQSRLGVLTETQKAAFLLFKGFRQSADDNGEFYISQEHAAKKLGITRRGVGKIIEGFISSHILAKVHSYDVREGKSARYKWTANEQRSGDDPW